MRRVGRVAVAAMLTMLVTTALLPSVAVAAPQRGRDIPVAEVDAAPHFRSGSCPVDLHTRRHVDCGVLRVPQVRGVAGGRTISVAVAIVRAPKPLPDPILFLMGGPDYPAIDPFSIDYFKGGRLARNRDLILIDVRGIGSSRPFLGCPELDEFAAESFPEVYLPGQIYRIDDYVAAHRACRQRLMSEGVVPRAHGAAAVALDLRDLRSVLGIDQWNVVAFSAGGEATLELMRLDPTGIRSVILDSIVTRAHQPSFDFFLQGSMLMEAIFRRCARQPDCAAAFPNLKRRFYAEVDRLNNHPVSVKISASTGDTVTWTVDGNFLLNEAAYLAGRPSDAALLPATADYLARGNILEFAQDIVLEPPFPVNGFIAQGRTFAARCRENVSFQTSQTVADALTRAPRMAHLFTYEADMRVCRAWKVGRSDPAGYGYLDSDLPVLTFRGEWDGAPNDAGRILGQARHFPNGYVFTFPDRGHGQLIDFAGSGIDCPLGIANDFITHPDRRPDASCIDEMPATVFSADPL